METQSPPSGERTVGVAGRRVLIGIVVAAIVVAVVGLLVGRSDRTGDGAWAGTVLEAPAVLPEVTLTDTAGQPFDLRADTAGTTTILMFGYTSCPDVCPINLSSLSAALDELGPNQSAAIRVVFVSVDPGRDTPEVVRSYLDEFDQDFIGLSGGPTALRSAQEGVGVERSEFGATGEDGDYEVGHASAMFVFGPDGTARIAYPFGTRQSDWTRDLPRLLRGEVPA